MQNAFDFGLHDDLSFIYRQLAFREPVSRHLVRRTPVHQLIRSMLGSRTKDPVSVAAFERLIGAYKDLSALSDAKVTDVLALIADVTHADQKAVQILEALAFIRHRHSDFDLAFLARMPVNEAKAWLQQIKGVGGKIAAAVVNFSLRRRAFVADTHVLRVLGRYGCIGERADGDAAHHLVTEVMTAWTPDDFEAFHVYLKRLGQTLCEARRARCDACPLVCRCRTARKRAPAATRGKPEQGQTAILLASG